MKSLLLLGLLITTGAAQAQTADVGALAQNEYRATPERINNLVHTKLDARFDYAKSYLLGKAWLTLKPHFYPTDSVQLNAKGMDIKTVALVKGNRNTPLKYTYDGMFLNIRLDKTYKGGEPYTLYIDYYGKTDELKAQGSAAITDAKGLYFINPRGEEKNKPTQIWTQGETEATSVWVPTIDRPGQKNHPGNVPDGAGKICNPEQRKINDAENQRRRHPHRLLENGAAACALPVLYRRRRLCRGERQLQGQRSKLLCRKGIRTGGTPHFGGTPEMMALYSRLTGVDYPWAKYSQIVGRDYVSGAMENTTATLHQEGAQQDARELTDGNRWEEVIAHELFHQWFGDYVTAESWSNLPLNESFATLGSQLWNEYKYGRDAGDAERYSSDAGLPAKRQRKKAPYPLWLQG
jgi:aminopeptidase N